MGSFGEDDFSKGENPALSWVKQGINRYNDACSRRAAAAPLRLKLLSLIGIRKPLYNWQEREPIYAYMSPKISTLSNLYIGRNPNMYSQACYDIARAFLLNATEKKWSEQTVTTIAQAIQDTIEEAIDDLEDEDKDEEKETDRAINL